MFANRRDFLLKIELNGKFMFFFLKSIILFAKGLVSGKLLKMGKNTQRACRLNATSLR